MGWVFVIVMGIIIGALGKFVAPGDRDNVPIWATILAGILDKAPNKEQFEIPNVQISDEPYGLGMRKGDKNFVDFVNKTLLEMEKSGEAKRIFDKWFGPTTQFHLQRNFKITADK